MTLIIKGERNVSDNCAGLAFCNIHIKQTFSSLGNKLLDCPPVTRLQPVQQQHKHHQAFCHSLQPAQSSIKNNQAVHQATKSQEVPLPEL